MWHTISWISSINFSIFIFQYMSIYIYIHYLPSYLHLFLFRSKPQVPPVLLAFPHSFRKGLNLTWTRSTLEPWASDSWTQGLRAIQGHWTRETHGTSWNIIPHCCERSWQAVKAIGIHRPLGKDLDESWWIYIWLSSSQKELLHLRICNKMLPIPIFIFFSQKDARFADITSTEQIGPSEKELGGFWNSQPSILITCIFLYISTHILNICCRFLCMKRIRKPGSRKSEALRRAFANPKSGCLVLKSLTYHKLNYMHNHCIILHI